MCDGDNDCTKCWHPELVDRLKTLAQELLDYILELPMGVVFIGPGKAAPTTDPVKLMRLLSRCEEEGLVMRHE